MEISESTSKRITALRFPLMLLVMIKHNVIVKGLFIHDLPFEESSLVTIIKEFFANGLGELAVPVFFIFSGFLLFSSEKTYLQKLKSRFRSIFVPYTIWTVVYFGVWLILKKMEILTGEVNPVTDWQEWTFRDYILRFFGYKDVFHFPFVGSFWFLRDLMILVFFSPVLKFLVKRFPLILFSSLLIFYIFAVRLPLIHYASAFYFSLGSLFAVYGVNFFEACDNFRFKDSLILFLVGFLFFYFDKKNIGNDFNLSCSFFLMMAGGIVTIFKSSKLILENEKVFGLTKYLAPLTFFVYAVHAPVLQELVKKLTLHAKFPSLLQFLLACILDIGLSLLFAIIFRKLFPSVFAIICGGKREK